MHDPFFQSATDIKYLVKLIKYYSGKKRHCQVPPAFHEKSYGFCAASEVTESADAVGMICDGTAEESADAAEEGLGILAKAVDNITNSCVCVLLPSNVTDNRPVPFGENRPLICALLLRSEISPVSEMEPVTCRLSVLPAGM